MRTIKNLFNIMFAAARARIMPLWIKLRMWSTPAFIKSKVLVKIREFFSNLLDVRPRDQRDYYPVFRWLVSKRLAFALVVALGLASVLYITMVIPENLIGSSGETVPTYQYRALPLKFHTGTVKILAKDGYIAYDGQVAKGAASGEGILYRADGSTVYEGQFENNMFNGTGTQYYPNGIPRYIGGFTDNLYNGQGSSFRPNGTLEYQGDHSLGVRTGAGTLCDSVGDPIFQGKFLNGEIAYHEFPARPTAEIAGMYSGATEIYQSASEYCVVMPEIDAAYSVKDGSNTLENEWTVDQLFVLKSSAPLENGVCTTISEVMEQLGEPLYNGAAWVNLPETVCWNVLAGRQPDLLVPVALSAEMGLENIYNVSGYDRDYQIYLYTFEKDGVLYTFYLTDSGASTFVMYSMEKA